VLGISRGSGVKSLLPISMFSTWADSRGSWIGGERLKQSGEIGCDWDWDSLVASSRSHSRSACSWRGRFLGRPGAPLSLNLHWRARFRHLEQPFLSPEHRSFLAPGLEVSIADHLGSSG
jgi:hypothetical protein